MSDNELAVVKRDANALMVNAESKALDVVAKINSLTLLTTNDALRLAKAQPFILSTYTDVPEYRPLVIKLSSVLNDGAFPTPDAKYWQCKKEAEVHFNQLVGEIYKYERSIVDVEEMDYIIASSKHSIDVNTEGIDPIKMGFEIRRMSIKRDEYLFNMKMLEKSIKYRIQEIVEWAAIAETMMAPECKYDTKDYNAHIAENLYKKLERDIASSDPASAMTYKAQLSTLQRILKDVKS